MHRSVVVASVKWRRETATSLSAIACLSMKRVKPVPSMLPTCWVKITFDRASRALSPDCAMTVVSAPSRRSPAPSTAANRAFLVCPIAMTRTFLGVKNC
ncbi:hypothetical protein [Corynebacterium senegalense]|uniref:hypothetical protein n=1 Tax=Corynebacterium senegalense TaxID=2080750 RepID=UPI001FE89A9A|nr:hypothetical protein [Corynebacterium senegalense]